MAFVDGLFSGSRFLFWAIAPATLLGALSMTLGQHDWTPQRTAVVVGLDLLALLLIVGLAAPRRGRWAARGAAGLVVAAYCAYLVDEWIPVFRDGAAVGFGSSAGEANALHAVLGLLVIGVPCLRFACFGSATNPDPDDLDLDPEPFESEPFQPDRAEE